MKGAICALVPSNQSIIEFLPTTIHPHELYTKLTTLNQTYPIRVVCVEKVHAIQGSSARSTFNFGFNLGLIEGVIGTLGVPLDKVTPKQWQKHLQIPQSCKDIKKTVAKNINALYPLASLYGPRGGLLDGRSDALSIADYIYHKYKDT